MKLGINIKNTSHNIKKIFIYSKLPIDKLN